MTKTNAHEFPTGITHDLLFEIRKALRTLRRAEKIILQRHRAEKRQRKNSDEWKESARLRELTTADDLATVPAATINDIREAFNTE